MGIMKEINNTEKIYNVVAKYPDVVKVMIELGFKEIASPGMLSTAGKVMTIEKGAKLKKIPWTEIVKVFSEHGYSIIKEN